MLNIFLTIITGIIALNLIAAIILGVRIIIQKESENREYKARVKKAMQRLKEETSVGEDSNS